MNMLIIAGIIAIFAASPAFADHNNPWAGPDDEVNSQYHDENQAFSADRPGEDEMNGVSNSQGRDSVSGRAGSNGSGGKGSKTR